MKVEDVDRYDIIGDIHGHATKLKALLHNLGYTNEGGSYRHPERKVIFVGDFIDRGGEQLETLEMMMAMVGKGAALAVMGNHEFNALAYATDEPATGKPLRLHNKKNREQHEAFLSQVVEQCSRERVEEIYGFFRGLPLWLDLGAVRVVHAFWCEDSIKVVENALQGKPMTDEFLVRASDEGSREYKAVESRLKGLEKPLPKGVTFSDKGGVEREEIRTRWWKRKYSTFGDIVLPIDALDDQPSVKNLEFGEELPGYPENAPPVFLGHYWMAGELVRLESNVACVDYSAGKDAPLVAYRWNGEQELLASRFVTSFDPPSTRDWQC